MGGSGAGDGGSAWCAWHTWGAGAGASGSRTCCHYCSRRKACSSGSSSSRRWALGDAHTKGTREYTRTAYNLASHSTTAHTHRYSYLYVRLVWRLVVTVLGAAHNQTGAYQCKHTATHVPRVHTACDSLSHAHAHGTYPVFSPVACTSPLLTHRNTLTLCPRCVREPPACSATPLHTHARPDALTWSFCRSSCRTALAP